MGGPGGGGFATRSLFEPLESDFVVVSWDEPGTGKSYHAVPIASLTPERFIEDAHAYIGNGQMVNTTENDVMGYQFAITYVDRRGDRAAADELRRNGPPPYNGSDMLGKYVAYLDVLNEYMGSLRYTVAVPIVPFLAPEYG
jgi:hypothetical protein